MAPMLLAISHTMNQMMVITCPRGQRAESAGASSSVGRLEDVQKVLTRVSGPPRPLAARVWDPYIRMAPQTAGPVASPLDEHQSAETSAPPGRIERLRHPSRRPSGASAQGETQQARKQQSRGRAPDDRS
jgi:hypothetical protein